MTQSARRICSASCAISFKAYSTPAAGAWRPWARSRSSRTQRFPRSLGSDGAGLCQQLLQLAALVHLERDVATPHQLAVDIELRKGRPLRVGFERFAHFRVFENIEMRKR